jgi:hypothetical protein
MIRLISFATADLLKSIKMFEREARESGFFDSIEVVTPSNSVWGDITSDITKREACTTKGYGCYRWKPRLIWYYLDKLNLGDILVYLDVGFAINGNGRDRFEQYLELVKESQSGILVPKSNLFSSDDNGFYAAGRWTNDVVLDFFELQSNQNYLADPMIWAGFVIIEKRMDKNTVIENWRKLSVESPFLFLDNNASSPRREFVSHRHDQAVLNALIYRLGAKLAFVDHGEILAPIRKRGFWGVTRDWGSLADSPFHARQRKRFTLYKAFLELVRKIYRRTAGIKN